MLLIQEYLLIRAKPQVYDHTVSDLLHYSYISTRPN